MLCGERLRTMAFPKFPESFSSPLRLLTQNPEEVLKRLRQGCVESIEWCREEVVDFHLLYGTGERVDPGMRSGLP